MTSHLLRPIRVFSFLLLAASGATQAAGLNTLVTLTDTGAQLQYGFRLYSGAPASSADGRYIVYATDYPMVTGDTNRMLDVYLFDRVTRRPQRISGALGGFQPTISADGRYVAYAGNDDLGGQNILVYDRSTRATTRVSAGTTSPTRPFISSDGRFVAWDGWNSTYCPGPQNDIHVHDRLTRRTVCVTTTKDGKGGDGPSWNPSLSADGRQVLFISCSRNLVADDTYGYAALFVRNLRTKTTRLLSRNMGSCTGTSTYLPLSMISASGGYAVYQSNGIQVLNLVTGVIERADVNNAGVAAKGSSAFPSISADGRWVAFTSSDTQLVANDTNSWDDVFLRDRVAKRTTRVPGVGGAQPNSHATPISLSGDGRHVAFTSVADNFVSNDKNSSMDVFVRDQALLTTARADTAVLFKAGPTVTTLGSRLSYQVEVSALTGSASGTEAQIIVPAGLTPLSVTSTRGSCVRSNHIVCRIGQLAAGAKAVITLQVTAAERGTVRLAAMAGAAPLDSQPANNLATRSLTVQ